MLKSFLTWKNKKNVCKRLVKINVADVCDKSNYYPCTM